MPGYLITFEGPEGGGKTTQIRRLTEHLRSSGLEVLPLREPGGTSISEQIRDVVHDLGNTEMDLRTEAFLYLAARAQLCGEVILPFLDKGGVVMLDRYADSTLAYQGYMRGLGVYRMDQLNQWATRGREPDVTFLLDVEVKVGLARKGVQGEWNRLDALEVASHEKVRQAYMTMFRFDETRRWVWVDASRSPDEISAEIIRLADDRLISAGLMEGGVTSGERKR
jgi:dTMP kinase